MADVRKVNSVVRDILVEQNDIKLDIKNIAENNVLESINGNIKELVRLASNQNSLVQPATFVNSGPAVNRTRRNFQT